MIHSATIAVIREGGCKNPVNDENVAVYDEVAIYQNTRYVSASKAIFHLNMFKMHFSSHNWLAIYEKKRQTVWFQCGQKRYDTYCEAAAALGLLAGDKEWDRAMSEATTFKLLYSLRQLFSNIYIFCDLIERLKLWKKYFEGLRENFKENGILEDESNVEQKALAHVYELLAINCKSLKDFYLPPLDRSILMRHENEYDVATEEESAKNAIFALNKEQRAIFDAILKAIYVYNSKTNLFCNTMCINAATGTSKTYLYKIVMYAIRARKETVIPVS